MTFMRVSQNILFDNFIRNMNSSLSELMELNIQASSQKRINKPSDDPSGTAIVMDYRRELSEIDQFQENISTARGWLSQQDETLIQVNTVITRCKELAEQAASGTYDKDNREQISFEMRQLFQQLVSLSNTEYEGKHVFAGHKTEQTAFVQGLAATTAGVTPPDAEFYVEGDLGRTALVQFLDDGSLPSPGVPLDYRFSFDGGETWSTGQTSNTAFDVGGARVTLVSSGATFSAVDPDNQSSSVSNGTWMWIRPTAIYQGDDEDTIQVDSYGATTATADGVFKENIYVRIDQDAPNLEYSFSQDRGLTWVTGNTTTAPPNVLAVPGGVLTASAVPSAGEQFVIRPNRASLELDIAPNERIGINSVGKDIFGGIYYEPFANSPTTVFDGAGKNLFETVGKLVGYMETNNQSGIQEGLEDLREASEHMLTQAARVGGKENRLDVAEHILQGLELNRKERVSDIEDVDVSELMTKLAQQQIVYESVLKSSSTIMRMSLVNYI